MWWCLLAAKLGLWLVSTLNANAISSIQHVLTLNIVSFMKPSSCYLYNIVIFSSNLYNLQKKQLSVCFYCYKNHSPYGRFFSINYRIHVWKIMKTKTQLKIGGRTKKNIIFWCFCQLKRGGGKILKVRILKFWKS